MVFDSSSGEGCRGSGAILLPEINDQETVGSYEEVMEIQRISDPVWEILGFIVIICLAVLCLWLVATSATATDHIGLFLALK